jgi:hypothetical protein
MKVKLSTIIESQLAMQVLCSEKLPLKLGWRIRKNIRKIQPEFDRYAAENLILYQKFGAEKEPKGCGKWELLPENNTAYSDENKDILKDEIEVNVQPIPLSLFDFAPDPKYPQDKYRIPPSILIDLDWMLLDDEAEKPPIGDE